MNRMSFVGLKRVGGGEIYIKKDEIGGKRKGGYNANPFAEGTVGTSNGRRRIAKRTCVSVAN